MSVPSLCIRRPAFTLMLTLLPVVMGLGALRGIGIDLFPDIDLPIVMITTARPGASVEEMETGVTKVIEEAVNTIAGIDELRSTTTEGLSVVTIQFLLGKNRDVAQQDVQGKVNTVLSRLPTGTEAPIIDKFDVSAAPVMTVAISGRRSMRELTEIVDKQIRENLSSLDGVGAVVLVGGNKRAIQVTVDARRCEAFGLSIAQVQQALARQNLELPGGRVDQNRRELVLRTMGRVGDPEQFRDVIVADLGGHPVRIRDLGGDDAVRDSFEEPRSLVRLDGENAVALVVQKQGGTNTVKVIDTVDRRLAELRAILAQQGKTDIQMRVARDTSRFIRLSLHEVEVHTVLGAILVVLTILLFLRDWRTTLIAGLAIPVSVLAVFPVMQWLGLTLNNITLIGMVLMIGIVIDDAIIVVENVFRWMEEEHLPPMQAAVRGAEEITLAVIATSLSLFVIFIPIAFMGGTVGLFLRSFGIVCAVAILISMVVSLTLTPMMSSRFLRMAKAGGKGAAGADHHSGGVYGWLVERPYLACLRWGLRHRGIVVLATVAVTASIFPLPFGRWLSFGNPARAANLRFLDFPGLVSLVGFNFIPMDDQSEFEIAVTTPAGWSLNRTEDVLGQVEGRLRAMPEVTSVMTTIGDQTGRLSKAAGPVTQATIYVRLLDLDERRPAFTQFDVMNRCRTLLREWSDLRVSVQRPQIISTGAANADLEFLLTGPDLDRLQTYASRIIDRLRARGDLADVDTTLADRKPELRVLVDRERAMDQGVAIDTVAATLQVLVGGRIVSDFKDDQVGELYDVWLRASGVDRDDPVAIGNLTVPGKDGRLVRLAGIANSREAIGPAQIDRAQRQRKISIIANLAGATTTAASQAFYAAFAALDAPPEYALAPIGRAKSQAEAVGAFVLAFLLSLLLMYMILAAQFEHLIHPITILMAVPMTIPFALVSLLALGQPLTLFSVLALFLLFGIVKKNGILQVDYTNVLRQRAAEQPAVVPAAFRDPASETGDRRTGGGAGWRRWVGRQTPETRTRLWAILEANRVRLRPILMTTLMLVTAMIPIALGQGPGAANRADMAKVIVGGQGLSLVLSLLVTPVTYSLFDDLGGWLRRRARRARPADVSTAPAATVTPT